jgi:hypothetical protein
MNRRWRVWTVVVDLLSANDDPALAATIERQGSDPLFWTDLVSIANWQLVTATLWSALQRTRLDRTAPNDVQDYLRSFHAYNTARNDAILAQLAECVETFNRSGIEPMLLKGTAYLASSLHGHVGDRYLSDIDLLVPGEAAEEAFRLVAELGYRPGYERDYSAHHHFVPMIRDGTPVALELHRAPVPSFAARALPLRDVWVDSMNGQANGRRYRLPSPTDAAMLVYLHAIVVDRNFAQLLLPLRLLHDASLLQSRHGESIDWDENIARAAQIGKAASLRRYLHALTKLFSVPRLEPTRRSLRDTLHFSLCAGAVRWPALLRWAERADRLSARRIEEKYGSAGTTALNRHRLREVAGMLKQISRP